MKYIILGLLLTLFHSSVKSQPASDVNKISLSVVMPENLEGLDVSQLSKIETKISQIVTISGIGSSGYNNNFVIYPKFSVVENNIVEGGLQNIHVIKCEFSLYIKQVDNNILFSTFSKMITGSGNNRTSSLTNAISKIDVNDKDFKVFLDKGKNKIVNYYETNCSDIITKADFFSKKQEYEQAIGLLMSVPQEVKCFSNVQQKTIEIYKAYQNQRCKMLIHEANLSVANNNYAKAIETLALVDPSSSCFKEVDLIVKKIEGKIDVEQKRQLELRTKIYNDKVALEKQRIDAVKEIAIAYYKNKPAINYNYIIR